MSLDKEQRSNPQETEETAQQTAEDAVFGSSESFFEAVDNDVNGQIIDNEPEQVTPQQEDSNVAGANVEGVSPNDEVDNLKKRYGDSTREAQRMKAELDQLQPFVPLLEAMKTDSGLVDYVRDYFTKGGDVPTNVKEQLKLDEDFEFDPQEAISDPESDSAKLQNAHIDQLVQSRVGNILNREKKNATMQQKMFVQKKQEVDFVKKHGMTNEEFAQFKNLAKQRSLSLDDVYYLLNKDKAATNVANNTKQDMLNQMKNVRNIPTSASDSNNQGSSEKSPEDRLFEGMLNVDGGVDDLFG